MRTVRQKNWIRPGWYAWLTAVGVFAGVLVFLYPQVASWFSQYQQSRIISGYSVSSDEDRGSTLLKSLANAYEYNKALSSGAVLHANTNKPSSGGSGGELLDYKELLNEQAEGVMARIQIPAIDVDLPVYHGTSDAILLKGAGHLEGSSLPVGGAGTRSVITAHRGLANATMFSNLDQVQVGDRFTIRVLDEVLTYEINEKTVIEPEDTEILFASPDEDLVTLITCTPLGINTHRIIVTGERVTPTPIKDIEAATAAPTIPGFPTWSLYLGGTVALLGLFIFLVGRSDAKAFNKKRVEPDSGFSQRANPDTPVFHGAFATAESLVPAKKEEPYMQYSEWMPPLSNIKTYEHFSEVPQTELAYANADGKN